jgi:plasmid maintenance system antidote protein VapI
MMMKTDPLPASRGGELVLRKLKRRGESLNSFSAQKGYARGRLSRVVRGETACSRDLAIDLRDELGIPVDAWDEPPSATAAA